MNEWEIATRLRAALERQRILEELLRTLQMQLGKAQMDLAMVRQAPYP